MDRYSVGTTQSAQQKLDALDDALFTRIDRKMLALADNPRPSGCKKLKGHMGPVARPGRHRRCETDTRVAPAPSAYLSDYGFNSPPDER